MPGPARAVDPDRLSQRDHVLDVVFLVGVALKGLDGLGELVLGIPLLFLSHAQVTSLAHSVTAEELSEDPHDLLAHLLLKTAAHAGNGMLLFVGLYLLVHGVVKVAIVLALIWGKERIYPWAIAALAAFAVFQIVDLVLHPSITVVLLTLLDLVVIALTWREWHQHRTLRQTLSTTVAWLRSGRRRRAEARGRR